MLYLRIDKKNQCENYNLFRLYASNGPNLKGDSIGKRKIDFSVTELGLCNKDKETTANASKGEIISGINYKLTITLALTKEKVLDFQNGFTPLLVVT